MRSAAPTTNGSPSASLPTALPATVESGPIEPRVEVRLEVPGEPDWMASGAGSVWVKTADGYVQRIDPATNQVVANIECRRTAGSRLQRAGRERRRRVDVFRALDGVVVAVDPEHGAVPTRVDGLTDARQISANGDALWVGFRGAVARVDPATGEVNGVVDASSADGDIEATGDAVWVRTGGLFLRRVDPNTLEVVEDLTAAEQSGGEVIVAYGSVWATAYDDNVLYRIRPD